MGGTIHPHHPTHTSFSSACPTSCSTREKKVGSYTPAVGSASDHERQRRCTLRPASRACAKSLREANPPLCAYIGCPESIWQMGGS